MLRVAVVVLSLLVLLGLAGAGTGLAVFWHYGKDLPDYRQLADYDPAVMTRVHAGDGRLIAEFAREKRAFVPITAIPKRVVHAFLAAEDKTFYDHFGIDLPSIAVAAYRNVRIKLTGADRRPVGASTITQQVAKNFLLTNEVSLTRKIKEAILALRMEHAFSKDHILELYLNEIYLGLRSYGVAAAALNYFDKSLDELTLAEAAYLGALPKAPNNYHPRRHPDAAVARRNWVLDQMANNGFVTPAAAARARQARLVVRERAETEMVDAPFYAEEVRRQLADRYSETTLYEGGLSVRTSLDPDLQGIARRTLRDGLIAYDRRHGWRGPIDTIDPGPGWAGRLAALEHPEGLDPWSLAVVLSTDGSRAVIGLDGARRGAIPMSTMKWARKWIKGQHLGPRVSRPAQVVSPGDVVAVSPLHADPAEGEDGPGPQREGEDGKPLFALEQLPDIEGAIVALDPHTGRVLAMVGGYSFARSEFNRATQARRQPGSAFKPFVYLTALESGFTPSTLVLDAPFVIDQGPGLGKWKPSNYANKFYGPSPMRLGIEKSRNLMTVRLAQTVGMDRVTATAEAFGVHKDLPEQLSMAIGAGETTLLRLATAYGMLVNGGQRITPSLIDRVQDKRGNTVFHHDDRPCPDCDAGRWRGQPVPRIPDDRERLVSAASAYQVVSMLEGVVQRGTGRRVAAVGKPLAGKTGTTNESRDTWFMGFTPDLVAGVFVGFDEPKPMGRRETGSSAAAPIFRDFMEAALEGEPAIPFRTPPGIRLVRINHRTGLPADSGDTNVILEAFKPGTVPDREREVLGDNRAGLGGSGPVPDAGSLY